MPIDAVQIAQFGWRQGSVFTLAASRPILLANRHAIAVPGLEIPDDSRLIVTSHDCDVVHQGPHEPRIEVCPALPLASPLDGNHTGTRNARRLHVYLEIGDVTLGFDLRAPTRFSLPREILQESAPDPDARIKPEHTRHFSHWLAKRFRRTALPTAFDARVSKQVRRQLRNILRPLADSIDSMLIAIDPDDVELQQDEPYQMQVVALMETRLHADPERRATVENAMRPIQELLDKCPGIELDACVVQSMGEMTVEEFRDFSQWDYDDLSLEVGTTLPQQA